MEDHVPGGGRHRRPVRTGAHPSAKALRVESGLQSVPISALWETGFTIPADSPRLKRGRIDIFDGKQHLIHALATEVGAANGVREYSLKTVLRVTDLPPRDFAPEGVLA